jgi:cobalamin biosynthesis protein CobT
MQVTHEQDVFGSSTCFDYSSNRLISEMENCRSYFHYATLFSDLSRNMTSSSDLFEDNSTDTQLQDNIESQGNVESNTEVNDFQEEDASDTNQTSSPSSSSDLFEDNNENTQLQENVENNNTDIDQQDEITTELQGSNDNNTIFG